MIRLYLSAKPSGWASMLAAVSIMLVSASAALMSNDYWDVSPSSSNFRTGVGAPEARAGHATVLVNGRLFVFGGQALSGHTNTGALYETQADVWLQPPALSSGAGAPSPRYLPSIATDGTRVFVFGGGGTPLINIFNNGGIYHLQSDTWEVRPNLSSGLGAPGARYEAFAVWTGDRFLVFGGGSRHPANSYRVPVHNGGMYDPATDTWEVVPALNNWLAAPEFNDGAVWTGEHMVARGGFGASVVTYPGSTGFVIAAGGVFDPASRTWLPRPNLRAGVSAPDRWLRPTVWTGEWYLEWGGRNEQVALPQVELFGDGQVYIPAGDGFLHRPVFGVSTSAPARRMNHTGLWTGSHLFVIGGEGPLGQNLPFGGGLYDPIGDVWEPTPNLTLATSAPEDRFYYSCVWNGSEVLIWGGSNGQHQVNTGGVYVPPRVAPTIRSGVPTGLTQTTWPMGGVPPGGEQVDVGVFWRHRVTVYGCPRATVTVTGMPGWMTQKYLDTGCFLEGTPGPGDNHKLHQISIVASNGIGVDAIQSFTLKVGNPLPPSQFFTQPITTAVAGELYQYTPLAVGTPTPIVVMTVGPSWLSWVGNKLQGRPPYSASATSVQVRLEAVAQGQSTGAQDFLIHVDYSPYDIDKDKSVDVVDVQTTVNLILSVATPTYPTQGDTDASGIVDVVDVQRIVNKILTP